MIDKPIITRVRTTDEMEKQFQNFFADKNILCVDLTIEVAEVG